MEIGIGLPNAVPGTSGQALVEWARDADEAGFSCVATTDRLVYDSHDAMVTLAAAAAVTRRCRLLTAILIAPLRGNGTVLAKQAATVDGISGGRLVLGMAAGIRPDDYRAAGVDAGHRGADLDQQVQELRAVWAGERRGFAGGVGPVQPSGPELLFGGHSPAAITRAARWGSGWIGGSGGPQMFAAGAAAVRERWTAERRSGVPRLLALLYAALGPDAADTAHGHIHDYYGFAPPYAEQVARSAAIGEQRLAELVTAFSDAGCDELVLVPCSADRKQLDLLADVALP